MTLPAHSYLEQRGIAHRRLRFPPSTEKGATNVARALGFSERQMVKTLIFVTDRDECVLVMLGGDQAAISRHLKQAIGSRNIKLASPELVQATTGYVIGSIPPFHWQPPGFRAFIDAALMQEAELGVGAGEWGYEIIITPRDLVAASAAQIANLTDPDRPALLDPA